MSTLTRSLLALAFLPLAVPAVASAKAAAPRPPSTKSVEVELVESSPGGKTAKTVFVLPTHGEVEGWVQEGKDRRFCRVEADPTATGLRVDLRCSRSTAAPPDMHVNSHVSVTKGKRQVVAEVRRADGHKAIVAITTR